MRFYIHLLWIVGMLAGITVMAQDESSLLPITEDTTYQVRPADTLDTIGALFDVSPTCIAETNDITDFRTIQVGQSLLISVSCPLYGGDARDQAMSLVQFPREVVLYEDECDGYRVQRNDSIDMIGFNMNISMVSIALENNLEPPYVLEINQCLSIPEDAPPWGIYPALQTASGDPGTGGALVEGELYVLQPLETLDVVAQEYNVSVVSIMLANNITDARLLQPGTSFVIPADAPPYGQYPAIYEPVAGLLYVVQQGETLDDIAQSFNVAVVALETVNNIESGRTPQIGTTILIPDGVPDYGSNAEFDPATLGQGGGFSGQTHIVQPRETLDLIAAFYNINTGCLLEGNRITHGKDVQPGTVLIIDEACGPYIGEVRPALSAVISPADSTAESTDTSGEAVPLGESGG